MVAWECPTNPREASGLDPEAVHQNNAGEHIEDRAAFLREIGIDPDETPAGPHDLPEFVQ